MASTHEFVEQLKASQPAPAAGPPRVVGLAARSQIDQLVLDMLCIGVNSAALPLQPVDGSLDSAAALAQAAAQRPQIACIVALTPTRGSEVRSYCRKLRAQQPDTKLLVLRPEIAAGDVSRSSARMQEAGADCVVGTIQEAMTSLEKFWPQPAGRSRALQELDEPVRQPLWASAR